METTFLRLDTPHSTRTWFFVRARGSTLQRHFANVASGFHWRHCSSKLPCAVLSRIHENACSFRLLQEKDTRLLTFLDTCRTFHSFAVLSGRMERIQRPFRTLLLRGSVRPLSTRERRALATVPWNGSAGWVRGTRRLTVASLLRLRCSLLRTVSLLPVAETLLLCAVIRRRNGSWFDSTTQR